MDLKDIYKVFYLTAAQYTFFSATYETFFKIHHNLGHNASFNKYKKTEITICILSDSNTIKLEFNNKRNSRKHSNIWRLNNTLLSDEKITEEIRGKSKSFWNLMRIKAQPIRTNGT
jgi:hypothetical protein